MWRLAPRPELLVFLSALTAGPITTPASSTRRTMCQTPHYSTLKFALNGQLNGSDFRRIFRDCHLEAHGFADTCRGARVIESDVGSWALGGEE